MPVTGSGRRKDEQGNLTLIYEPEAQFYEPEAQFYELEAQSSTSCTASQTQ